MIHTEFKRDMQHNYMVINEDKEVLIHSYGIKMLLNNNISGLLKFELRVIDNINQYYYDVTQKQPIFLLYEKGQLKQKQIKMIIQGIISAIENGGEYLLKENDYILDPNYIFVDLSEFQVSLCYMVGYNIDVIEQFCKVIEYIMNKIDYKDKDAVLLIYELYRISRQGDCTLKGIQDILDYQDKAKSEQFIERKIEKVEKSDKKEVIKEKEKNPYFERSILYCILSAIVAIIALCVLPNIVKGIYWIIGFFTIIVVEFLVLIQILREEKDIDNSEMKEDMCILENLEEAELIPEDQCIGETMVLSNMEEERTYRLLPEDNEIFQEIELIEFPFFIGKLKTKVDYTLECSVVSRFHAKIEREEDGFYITDLNSTNGTFLNNIRLEGNKKTVLKLGDRISFANVMYFFTSG
jgi:hypothetical protein